MGSRTIRYVRPLPLSEYRWLYCDSNWQWELREPPTDFGTTEIAKAQAYYATDHYYLVAPFQGPPLFDKLELKEEPDLYLRFATTPNTPSAILESANAFGPLTGRGGGSRASGHLKSGASFCGNEDPMWSQIRLVAEPAIERLRLFEALRVAISKWSELAERTVEDQRDFLSQTEGQRFWSPSHPDLTHNSNPALHIDVDPKG